MLVLAVAVLACELPREEPMVSPPTTEDLVTEPQVQPAPPRAEPTARLLEEGVLRIPPDVGIATIDGWLERLEHEEVVYREEIIDALQDLRGELRNVPLDTDRIADLMDDLGNWTMAVGTDRNDAATQRLAEVLALQAIRLRAGYHGPADMPAVPIRPGDPGPPERPLPEEAEGVRD